MSLIFLSTWIIPFLAPTGALGDVMLCVYVSVCVFGTLCLRAVLDSFKAQDSLREPERWQASKQASKQTGKQEGKQEGKQAGRQAGRQEGRQAGR